MLRLDLDDPASAAILRKMGITPSKQPKYRNKKTTLDNRKFSSRKEAERYAELEILLRAGIITSFEWQVPFVVFDGFIKNNIKYQPITYVADFVVRYPDGHKEIEDTKEKITTTEVFKIKRKLFEARYSDLTIKVL